MAYMYGETHGLVLKLRFVKLVYAFEFKLGKIQNVFMEPHSHGFTAAYRCQKYLYAYELECKKNSIKKKLC